MNTFTKYDPSWLVEAAMEVKDEYPWLVDELSKCVKARKESKYYTYFVDPKNPNKPGSEWQFRDNIILEDTKYGDVVLDVLKDNRIGGVEFLTRLFED